MIRLIHTADWQLGKPFARFPESVRAALIEARYDIISRIGALAAARDIANVVVAGDVFDSTGPSDRDLIQALTRMARSSCTWWLMPGNHDHARADGLWSRVRAKAPANVRVLDEPVPVELADGAWLLPAPLEYRRTREDPTAEFSSMATPAGALRIGLAHGSVVDFGARGEAENIIPVDRAEQSGLDYLALGDWHGHLQLGPRTAYSGTPEIDRFGRDEPGSVIVAEIAPGRPPTLERIETGRFRWFERSWEVFSLAEFERQLLQFRQSAEPATSLLKLSLSGVASVADRIAIRRVVEDDLAHTLRWLRFDDAGLLAKPTDDDLASIDLQGALFVAANRLREMIASGGPAATTATRALERLYLETVRAGLEA